MLQQLPQLPLLHHLPSLIDLHRDAEAFSIGSCTDHWTMLHLVAACGSNSGGIGAATLGHRRQHGGIGGIIGGSSGGIGGIIGGSSGGIGGIVAATFAASEKHFWRHRCPTNHLHYVTPTATV